MSIAYAQNLNTKSEIIFPFLILYPKQIPKQNYYYYYIPGYIYIILEIQNSQNAKF